MMTKWISWSQAISDDSVIDQLETGNERKWRDGSDTDKQRVIPFFL